MVGRIGLIVGGIAVLGGCSSITQGTDQQISVNTNPPGASCALHRQGSKIGEVAYTPGTVTVDKTKHDIRIVCVKEGYQDATNINESGWESASGGAGIALDVFLTFGLSSAIDSATGADNKYDGAVNITLIPVTVEEEAEVYTVPATEPASTAAPQGIPTLDPAATPDADPNDPNFGNPGLVPKT